LKNNICISISEKPGNFGKIIHNAGYEELGLDWIYIPFKITNLENTIKGIRALNIRGCSVSMPFKEKVIPFLDEIDSLAKKIGSVNTIVNNNGILKGYNTDFIGFQKSFKKLHVMKHEKILILGSGGVAKSILVGLQNLKFRNIYICSRNLRNTKNFIKSLQCIFDVIVNPKETKLIKTAKDLKIKNQGGYLMALYQGAEQFKLYTTKNPPIDKMKKALNKNLM